MYVCGRNNEIKILNLNKQTQKIWVASEFCFEKTIRDD